MVRQSLIGGLSTSEGLVEVCVDGTYLPVSLDNGRFSVAEATVICRELGIGNGQLNQQYSLLPQILNRAVFALITFPTSFLWAYMISFDNVHCMRALLAVGGRCRSL